MLYLNQLYGASSFDYHLNMLLNEYSILPHPCYKVISFPNQEDLFKNCCLSWKQYNRIKLGIYIYLSVSKLAKAVKLDEVKPEMPVLKINNGLKCASFTKNKHLIMHAPRSPRMGGFHSISIDIHPLISVPPIPYTWFPIMLAQLYSHFY